MSWNRINVFQQIKAFYSWVFNNPDKVRPVHVSLYLFFINQANRNNWVEWFKCPYDLAMQGGCIGSKSTYYKILPELEKWGLIKYKPGINNSKAPLISLIQLYKSEPLTGQVPVPLSEPQSGQLTVPLPVPLSGNKYKLLTNNIKLITDNLDEVVEFLKKKSINPKDDISTEIINLFHEQCPELPKVKKITDTRKKVIAARIQEYGKDEVIQMLEKAGNSKFLGGDNEKGWNADFDWLFKPSNFIKVIEGNYNNKTNNNGKNTTREARNPATKNELSEDKTG